MENADEENGSAATDAVSTTMHERRKNSVKRGDERRQSARIAGENFRQNGGLESNGDFAVTCAAWNGGQLITERIRRNREGFV